MKRRFQLFAAAAGLALAAASLSGCAACPGVKAEPGRPREVVREPARPVGGPASITLWPAADVNPVKTQHVFVATVLDANGQPVSGANVEWILARGPKAVGDIVEVEGGRKIDNAYAESETGSGERVLDWGDNDPANDVRVGPGQTWCVITSAVEGTTNVIAYAPSIRNWNAHKAFAEKTWMDVTWEMPVDAVNRVGTPHTFNVRVMRFSDGSPYVGWNVHYRLLSGPAGSFAGGGGQTGTVTTGGDGVASIVLNQAEPAVGTNEVEILLVRPAKKDECECWPEKTFGPWVVRKTWVQPDIGILKTAPATALVGEHFNYEVTVTNLAADQDVRDVTVTDPLPEGVEYVSSSPAATVSGRNLTWNLGTMAPAGVQSLSITVRATRTGRFTNCARVTAEGGRLTRESCAETVVTAPALKIEKYAPETVMTCDPITYRIIVRNTGDGTAQDVRVVDQLPNGITAASGETRFEWPAFALAAGESREFVIDARAGAAGSYTNTATVTGAGGITDQASATTRVTACVLGLVKKVRRGDLKTGRPAEFDITVTNTGDAEARDTVVEDMIPAGMTFVRATEGGVLQGSTIVWNVGTLAPGASKTVNVTMTANETGTFTNTATARAYCCREATASDRVVYTGVAAVLLEVIDVHDPIEVGGQETYEIVVTNQGVSDDTNLVIKMTLPSIQKFVSADSSKAQGVAHSVDGQTITFAPVAVLKGRNEVRYYVVVEATAVGDARIAVELTSDQLRPQGPVHETESTTQY